MNDERPPQGPSEAAAAKPLLTARIRRGADNSGTATPFQLRPVLFEAEAIVGLEDLAIGALRRLTAAQLERLAWVGLTDDGWRRVRAELADRGIGDAS